MGHLKRKSLDCCFSVFFCLKLLQYCYNVQLIRDNATNAMHCEKSKEISGKCVHLSSYGPCFSISTLVKKLARCSKAVTVQAVADNECSVRKAFKPKLSNQYCAQRTGLPTRPCYKIIFSILFSIFFNIFFFNFFNCPINTAISTPPYRPEDATKSYFHHHFQQGYS